MNHLWPHLTAAFITIIGVWFFDWSIASILFVYWFETILVGVFNVVRMVFDATIIEEPTRRKPQGISATFGVRLNTSLLFCLYFSPFLFFLFKFIKEIAEKFNQPLQSEGWIWWIAVPLSIQKIVEYLIERYNGTGEKVLMTLFILPYLRIIVQQFVLIASSVSLILISVSPRVAAVGLISIKIGIEMVIAHLRAGRFAKNN